MVNENHTVNGEEDKPLDQEGDRDENSELVPVPYGEPEGGKHHWYACPPERGITQSGDIPGTAVKAAHVHPDRAEHQRPTPPGGTGRMSCCQMGMEAVHIELQVPEVMRAVACEEVRCVRQHIDSHRRCQATDKPEYFALADYRLAHLEHNQQQHHADKAVHDSPFCGEPQAKEYEAQEKVLAATLRVFPVTVEEIEHSDNEEKDIGLRHSNTCLDKVHELESEQESSDKASAGGFKYALSEEVDKQYAEGGEDNSTYAPGKWIVAEDCYAGSHNKLACWGMVPLGRAFEL